MAYWIKRTGSERVPDPGKEPAVAPFTAAEKVASLASIAWQLSAETHHEGYAVGQLTLNVGRAVTGRREKPAIETSSPANYLGLAV
jgi:hypothetical protein